MDLTRRGFLAAALAIGLAGCVPTPDPRMSVPSDNCTLPDIWQQASASEQKLAEAYTAATVIKDGADWCQAAATMHAAHAATLLSCGLMGTYQPPAPIPSQGPVDEKTALSQLQKAIEDATTTATAGLKQAKGSPEALLFASLLVCCAVGDAWCADTTVQRTPPIPGTVVPSQIIMSPPADAAATALDRCYALSFALTAALGQTDSKSQLHKDVAARLTQTGTLASSLQSLIMAAGLTPVPRDLSYDLPYGLSDDNSILATWGSIEGSLSQACTFLAGCLTGEAATTWATAAGDQMARATAMGQQLTWWPGWG